MDWCKTWQLSMNIVKCKHTLCMTIGGNSNRQYSLHSSYNSIIQQCTEESDLGVMILNFLATCTFIVQNVKRPK